MGMRTFVKFFTTRGRYTRILPGEEMNTSEKKNDADILPALEIGANPVSSNILILNSILQSKDLALICELVLSCLCIKETVYNYYG